MVVSVVLTHQRTVKLIEKSASLAPNFTTLLHDLKGSPNVVDIRNCGLIGAVQLAPRDGDSTIRGFEIGMKLWKAGFYVRFGGDTLQFGPMFNSKLTDLERLMHAVGDAIHHVG